jgi:hypothetical protein
VAGTRRTEARLLHRIEVDRVRAPAAVIAAIGEKGARSAVVVEGLAEPHRRPPPTTAPADAFAEEHPLALEVDRDPLEHPAAATTHERERGRGTEVVESVFAHRHWAETVPNAALPTRDGGRNRRLGAPPCDL